MIRFLLRLYPDAWRREYGEEFAEILASHQLTLQIVADVLASAAWQRFRHAPLWMWVGTSLMIANIAGSWLWLDGWLPWQGLSWLDAAEGLPFFLTAMWVASRKDRSFLAGVSETTKAMLIGASPGYAGSLLGLALTLLHPSPVVPLRLLLWSYGNLWLFVLRSAAFLGASGALCGTLIKGFKSRRAAS